MIHFSITHLLPKEVRSYSLIPVSIPKPTRAVQSGIVQFLSSSTCVPALQSSNDAPSDADPASFSLVKMEYFFFFKVYNILKVPAVVSH